MTVGELIGLKRLGEPVSFDQSRLNRSMRNLSKNLIVAGALCVAFQQGSDFRMRAMLSLPADEDWKPGCGRAWDMSKP